MCIKSLPLKKGADDTLKSDDEAEDKGARRANMWYECHLLVFCFFNIDHINYSRWPTGEHSDIAPCSVDDFHAMRLWSTPKRFSDSQHYPLNRRMNGQLKLWRERRYNRSYWNRSTTAKMFLRGAEVGTCQRIWCTYVTHSTNNNLLHAPPRNVGNSAKVLYSDVSALFEWFGNKKIPLSWSAAILKRTTPFSTSTRKMTFLP